MSDARGLFQRCRTGGQWGGVNLSNPSPLFSLVMAQSLGQSGLEDLGWLCEGKMFLQAGPVSEHVGERRTLRRFSMKLPASVKVSGIPCEFPTETENVSACGMFFRLDRWMTEGARVEITLNFPAEVTMSEPARVRLLARVVRVEPGEWATRVGVAVAIEEYEYQPTHDVEYSGALESRIQA